MYVSFNGAIDLVGDTVEESNGIRPAFRIDLKSEFFRSIIRHGPEGRIFIRLPKYFAKDGILIKIYPWAESIVLPEEVKKIAKDAVKWSKKLRSIDWKGSTMEIEKDAIDDCFSLKLPPKFFLTEKELDGQFAKYLPDDPKAIASVLRYQKNRNRWVYWAFQGIGEDRLCKVLSELQKESLDDSSRELLSRFSGPAARKGYVSATSMLLESRNENSTAFDPTKEYTLDEL